MEKGKVREFNKKRKVREKSGNYGRLSEPQSSTSPQVDLDDLGFCQNAILTDSGFFNFPIIFKPLRELLGYVR